MLPALLAAIPSGQLDPAMQRVMAAFIATFPAYTTWPTHPSVIRVGMIGPNPLGQAGRSYLNGRSAGGRTMEVILNPKNLQNLDILYIGDLDPQEVRKILKSVNGHPVLTVGEMPGFIPAGGMVQFEVHGKAATFDVSTANARRAGILIDPRLIKFGKATAV